MSRKLLYWKGEGLAGHDGPNSCHGPGRGATFVTDRCTHFSPEEIAEAKAWDEHCGKMGWRPRGIMPATEAA